MDFSPEDKIENLLKDFSLEELLEGSDLTPEETLLFLWEQGLFVFPVWTNADLQDEEENEL